MSAGVGPLPATLREQYPLVQGQVAKGFGRGSKKLGVPTANLPCSLFQQQLDQLPCGVYVGWAAVRDGVHKCVCNIGFSPTFVGEENPEKIIEAHLLSEFSTDFYGEQMRLLLLGFVRDERKFGGIEELLETINADIATARDALDRPPLSSFAAAPALSAPTESSDAPCFTLLRPTSSELVGASSSTPPCGLDQLGIPPNGFQWGGIY